MSTSSRILVAAGARAVERRLLDEIAAALPAGEIAAPPVVVVVPSASLRVHLLGRLAARRAAWLGLEVTTLRGAAASILDRTGGAPRSGEALEPIFAARLAARESALARALGGLVDGDRAVGGAVRDLLDAGFVEEHLEAVEERLELERRSVGGPAVDRAQAIARIAAGVRHELAARGLVPGAELLAEAARRLVATPELALPARALFVHGFVDATGVAGDLLVALARHRPATVLLDAPPELDGSRASWSFGARLRERLSGVAAVETIEDDEPAAPPAVFRAADPAREARAAIGWLAAASDSTPESAALVARDLDGLAAWARELDRQGFAGSADGGAPRAIARRAAGIVELLSEGDTTPLGVVLELAGERLEAASGLRLAELRLAFAALGARDLAAASALEQRDLHAELPIADRLERDDGGGARPRFRALDRAGMSRALARLREIRQRAADLAAPRPLGARLEATLRLLHEALPDEERATLAEPLAALAAPELAGEEVVAEEWRRLVEAAWSKLPGEAVGRGGGCALLSVTEARGRTFDRLAVAGLSRDRFPRAVRPDPLLPDALRLRLRELLPDLPVKAEGHDEERFLFAQLLAAGGGVALFRPLGDGEGRALTASPLVEELLRVRGLDEAAAPAPGDVPAIEAAIATGLAGDRAALAPALAAALEEAATRFGDPVEVPAERLAAARVALLDERTAVSWSATAQRLGAFFGFIGPPGEVDPRRRPPSVTGLERLAACGWQTFLSRLLRLRPLPELVDALPELPAALVGSVVHDVLQSLLPDVAERPLSEVRELSPTVAAWPAGDELQRRTRATARLRLAAESLDPALFETLVVREALARIEIARAVDWPAGQRELLGVEVTGEAVVATAGGERRIPFRADRVERVDGALQLTDYKTGKPLVDVVTAAKRRERLAEKIARAEALQLPVYLLGAAPEEARARYLYLHPDVADERLRETAMDAVELDRAALGTTLETLYAAWQAGAFTPRLVDRKLGIFTGCEWCEVRAACVQGDSGARQRFERWAQAPAASLPPEERPARAWFELRGAVAAAEAEDDR